MVDYSEWHDAWYDAMVRELLQYGDCQESVNNILRGITVPSERQARWIDDLYQVYGQRQVLDDD